jgi:glutathione peroxidase-family protein
MENSLKKETWDDLIEYEIPISIYDLKIASADGRDENVLEKHKGKVTLVFNVAAGCGNIPQHYVLEELRKRYENEPNFAIVAVVVDDFVCHGYPEFQNGIDSYIKENGLNLKPGEAAEKYAVENFKVGYEFTELTNGRYDKHSYDENYVPGQHKLQEIHPFWGVVTKAFEADFNEDGLPYHSETVPWSKVEARSRPDNKISYFPLRGNFEKFLFDKSGKKFKRYANGFLLGERDPFNETFPWFPEKYTEDGKKDYRPVNGDEKSFRFGKVEPIQIDPDSLNIGSDWDFFGKDWPTDLQKYGMQFSLDIISRAIDSYLAE